MDTRSLGTQNDYTILHPALEIYDYLACVSFRRKKIVKGKITESDLHIISTEGNIISTSSNQANLNLSTIVFEEKFLPSETVYIDQLIVWAESPKQPDAQLLYEALKDCLKAYLELPNCSYGLMAAWIIGTYFNRAFPCFPYLSALGPKETGKSNTLECLQYLCFNAVKTKLTSAALGDTADSLRGTILIDQAHNLEGELKEILVDSYKKGGGKRRIVDISNKGRHTIEFDCYCPKAFASLNPLPDDLADRTFTINMAPAGRIYPSPSASKRDWKQMRTDMVKLILTAYREVFELVEDLSETEGNRFGELWLPIVVILKLVKADQEEVDEIKEYCERQFSQVRYELSEWDYELVSIVVEWSEDDITSEQLLDDLRLRISDVLEERKPGKQWLGKAVKRLGLVLEKKGGKHKKTVYALNKEQASKLLGGSGDSLG
ncbi:hypothetical protein ACFLWI_05950 [Chloroflexota bacterium]